MISSITRGVHWVRMNSFTAYLLLYVLALEQAILRTEALYNGPGQLCYVWFSLHLVSSHAFIH